MKVDAQSGLQDFAKKRSFLLEKYHEVQQLYERLELVDELEMAKKQCQHLENESFKVLVVGEFKRGKSTFINALLGEEILPAYSIPCTAVINEVKYSEEKRAVLHFEKNLPGNLSQLRPEVREHIAKYSGKAGGIPPMEIPVEDIENYVVIADPGKDQAESVAESPYSRVELFWPIDLCRNQVEIVDSPGLNEHGTRTKVTTDYLAKADAIIFVLSCQALGSKSEMDTIADIQSYGHEELFFVCNFFDQVRERERPRLITYAQDKLKEYTSLGDGIHFISALNALNAKHDAEQVALQQSGFSDFEAKLIGFLVNGRGRLKLLNPANMLRRQLSRVLHDTLSVRRAMLGRDVEELQHRYEMEKPKLEFAEKRALAIGQKLMEKKHAICDMVRNEVIRFHKDLADEVPALIKGYETENGITVFNLKNIKEQSEAMCKELLQRLEEDIAPKQRAWTQEMREKLEEYIKAMFDDSNKELSNFFTVVDDVRFLLSAEGSCNDQRDTSGWERLVAAGVGTWLFGIGGAVQASQEGFTGLAKAALPQLAVIIGLGFFGVFNPLILVPALLGTGALTTLFSNAKLEDRIRDGLANKIKKDLLSQANLNADKAVTDINSRLNEVIEKIQSTMQQEIESVRNSVEKIILQKQEGEERMKEQRQLLDEQHRVGDKLVDELESFADQVNAELS